MPFQAVNAPSRRSVPKFFMGTVNGIMTLTGEPKRKGCAMTIDTQTNADAITKFWKALRHDMTVMLESGTAQPRPMTAQVDGDADHGPIWFFSSMESELVLAGTTPTKAAFTFVDKGHGTFAHVNGHISLHNDRATIDRLWNPFVAAWYDGKDDPKLALLRFDPADAKIWFDASSIMAGIKMLFGADPKETFKDKVAEVTL
jgi:general stress protein 26